MKFHYRNAIYIYMICKYYEYLRMSYNSFEKRTAYYEHKVQILHICIFLLTLN
jgi:hypothetical protein